MIIYFLSTVTVGITPYQHTWPSAPAPNVLPQPSQVVVSPPNSLWDFYRKLKEPDPIQSPTQSAIGGLRNNAEGALVGAVLGFIHGEFGSLDIAGKYPADGIGAALLYAMSVKDAGKPGGFSSDLSTMSSQCSAIFLYRKIREMRERTKSGGSKTTPTSGHEDNITKAGKRLLEEEK